MITLAWYILKVIICSGILYGYYYLALRNKIFNRWNRLYLLASVVLALSVPLIKINIFQNTAEDKGTVIRMLQTFNNSDEIIIEYSRQGGLQFTTENIIIASYLFITLLFSTVLFVAFYKIYRLRKKYPTVKMREVNFIATDAKGTPFSFFKSIFWNNAIDLHSPQGQQIFNHEIAHVKEKHSYDKMFMNVVLLFFWMNPFFWLMRKELYMIHEFIADKEALEDNDLNAFAEMVLQTVYPNHNFTITNNFFHSPLKRRLIMFSKNKNPKVNYLSRQLVLPLTAIVFFAFTIKMKTISKINPYSGKKITVVIDAGHGGSDNGAMTNNINEKDLNLAIAKDVQALNTNPNLVIILSRVKDVDMPLKERTNFANDKKADLFISIHADVDANEKDLSGLAIVIPKNDNPYLKGSQLLGSAMIQSFQNNYPLAVSNTLQQLQQGVWVLKANECPAVLIETGFLSNQKDANFLINPKNQETIAQNILNGIEKYTEQNLRDPNHISRMADTIPSSNFWNNSQLNGIFVDTKNKIILRSDKIINTTDPNKTFVNLPIAVLIVDGKRVDNDILKTKTIVSKVLTIHSGDEADLIKIYGADAKNGVFVFDGAKIIDKPPYPEPLSSKSNDKVFTKVENEAQFPGGPSAWTKYIISKIQDSIQTFTNKDYGTCLVKFIVNTEGSVSQVEATSMKDSHLAKISVEAVKTGPKWIPATQNGNTVAAYRLQPVTLTNADKK
jgi:N-acetylmuramoyl-L-alanine amidase